MTTALIYHPIYLQHNTGQHHPERPSRLQSIFRKLRKTDLIKKLHLIKPTPASIEDIELVHPKKYIMDIKEKSKNAPLNLDPDTPISKDSFKAATFAAGGVIEAIDLVFKGVFDNAFCMVRPPGHHARLEQAMGFCLFNNISIGARYLQKKYKLSHIAIIDWDVHHGNGTEEIFYDDPAVFYISLHEYPLYPGTGYKESIGEGRGKGFNLNIPMVSGSGDTEYEKAFKDLIIPKLNDYKPECILISAGFDGHIDDPLSSINLTEHSFSQMTKILKDIAGLYSNNRIISVLEGGYNLASLANSVHSHIEALL